MKKTFIAIALGLALASAAQAQHRQGHWGGGGNGYRGGPGIGWFVPALITGAIVYGATRPSEPAQVIVYPTAPQVYPVSPLQQQQQQPICPQGTDATYSRSYVQDAYGRYIETYQFTGCLARQ